MNKVFAILLRCIGIGSVAGLIATIPMTLFMLLMQQLLPKWQKYALPPERITTELAKRAKVGKHMNKPQRVGATLIMHFGYGSNMGIFYAPYRAENLFLLRSREQSLVCWYGLEATWASHPPWNSQKLLQNSRCSGTF